jgi:hypothetical protein
VIVRVRPPGIDQYGDELDTEPTRTTLAGAFVAPRTSGDVDDRGRSGVVVGLDLFTPYGTEIAATDQIEVDDVLYRIVGVVAAWKNPLTGWEAGQTCALERGQG